jgi:hypothetical protein
MSIATRLSSRLPFSRATSPVLRRFIWKDLRTLGNLWLGVATVATLVLTIALWLLPTSALDVAQVAIPWGAGAICALAAAISLFATEREDHTDGFLVLLPRYERSLLAGKAIAASSASLALVIVLGLASIVIAGGRLPEWQFAASVSANASLVMLEWFVWGIAIAILCPHPLLAAVIAIAAAVLSAELAFAASSPQELSLWLARDHIAAPQRLLVVAAIALLDLRLGLRWLDPPQPRRRRRTRKQTGETGDVALERTQSSPAILGLVSLGASATLSRSANAPRSQMFVRLLWQAGREAWPPMLAALPAGLFLTATVAVMDEGVARVIGGVSLAPFGWLIIPALFGSLAFRADQRARSCDFLHVRGARPAIVWASRQAIWLTAALVLGLVIQLALPASQSRAPDRLAQNAAPTWSHLARQSLLGWPAFLAAFGCGQLCSMMLRSSIVSGFAAVFLSMLVVAWSIAVELWQLPASWFVGAIGLGSLAATLVDCRAWLAERSGVRRWLPPAAALSACMLLVVATLPAARLAQLPDPNFAGVPSQIDEILLQWNRDSLDARAVSADYLRLAAKIEARHAERATALDLIAGADQHAFFEACQHDFDELALVSAARRCRLPSSASTTSDRQALHRLVAWLQDDGARHRDAGDLRTAWTRLMTARRMAAHAAQYQTVAFPTDAVEFPLDARHEALLAQWSVAPGQAVELLKSALTQLSHAEQLIPAPSELVVVDYLRIRELIANAEPARNKRANPSAGEPRAWMTHLASIAHRLPGERTRALAALRHLTEARLAYVDAVCQGQVPPTGIISPAQNFEEMRQLLHPSTHWSAGLSRTPRRGVDPQGAQADDALSRQSAIDASETSFLPALELARSGSLVDAMLSNLDRLARRRGELIRLALVAYRLEHGAYPGSLSALVTDDDHPGNLPAEAIRDPYSGGSFDYRPQGLSLPILGLDDTTLDAMIPANTPLLWSVGGTFVRQGDAWVAEARADDGGLSIVRAQDPGRFPPSPHGETPVHVAKFYSGAEFANRGPILFVLPR